MAPIKEWYGVYNVIYRWFEEKYGKKALEEYWQYIAEHCFEKVPVRFRNEGIQGIHDYFSETFDKEGGVYSSTVKGETLTFEVTQCPDYEFMNASSNRYFKPIEDYCKHHEIINSVLTAKTGYSFCMAECSRNGRCKWIFEKQDKDKGGDFADST